MPTETERCIEFLLAVFQMHCGKGRNSRQLSKTEFLPFMNTEMAPFTKNPKDPGVLDRGMKQLDRNSDGRLDFQEFLNLIGGLAMACHESFLGSSGSVSNPLHSLPATKSSSPPPTSSIHTCTEPTTPTTHEAHAC
ncbi:protein S100-A11-like [Rattus norvegicus]|uniref:protein S100-A11-like n=1 Tax=Rattus norvegicus TaxID=10116 RepID=UPI0003D0F401|nr:protein S100-A11-like [Rattus norvegicus]